jgi:hypothetical protein
MRAHPHLYELSAWPWLERLSRRHGRYVTLGDVPADEWDRVASLGFDLIYLMGVWERSSIGREIAQTEPALRREYDWVLPGWTEDDVPGSPFSIRRYAPDERMGGWSGLDAARAELHSRGLRLVVDFVPNHTGFDFPWVAAHPDRYVLGTKEDHLARPGEFRDIGGHYVACGRDPFFLPWTDVAQLNYFNSETRRGMADVLRELSSHCDGVRCDMAMLVLNEVFERTWRHVLRDEWPAPGDEFWPEAIARARSLTFLAEVYWDLEWTLQQQGFDFTYDKRLLDRLHGGSASEVRSHLLADPGFRDRLARFLENHDEPRSAAAFGDRLQAAVGLFSTLPGLRFYFDGQLDGARFRPPVQLGRWPDERIDPSVKDLYDRVLRLTRDPLFHDGEWQLLEVTGAGDASYRDLIVYRWRSGNHLAIVASNAGWGTAQGLVNLASDLPEGAEFDFTDELTDATYRWARGPLIAQGLYIKLQRGRAHLLTVRVA